MTERFDQGYMLGNHNLGLDLMRATEAAAPIRDRRARAGAACVNDLGRRSPPGGGARQRWRAGEQRPRQGQQAQGAPQSVVFLASLCLRKRASSSWLWVPAFARTRGARSTSFAL